MRVIPVAATQFFVGPSTVAGYKPHNPVSQDADELAEFAGRNCYQSWGRPNPKTATNQGYMQNILNQGHYSVLEHASVSFFVDGASRALLTELERHRFLSFSVISQRYCDPDEMEAVVPPLIGELEDPIDKELAEEAFQRASVDARSAYFTLEAIFTNAGYKRKKVREAARSVLPNATEVKMVVTGNLRAWRDVIGKRYHESADAEIRVFATEVLKHLKVLAPNSVSDIPEEPYK